MANAMVKLRCDLPHGHPEVTYPKVVVSLHCEESCVEGDGLGDGLLVLLLAEAWQVDGVLNRDADAHHSRPRSRVALVTDADVTLQETCQRSQEGETVSL